MRPARWGCAAGCAIAAMATSRPSLPDPRKVSTSSSPGHTRGRRPRKSVRSASNRQRAILTDSKSPRQSSPSTTLRERSMPADNSEQIAEWNGALGQRWAAMQREIDGTVVPFGDAALKAAAPQPGERVIDIGCGCGDTSIEIARMVGEAGAVLGIDVSQPMLEVARSRGALAHCAHLAFRDGDASEAGLPANTDLLFSRFGVMFFSQPSGAFSHLRKSLRTGGRCV